VGGDGEVETARAGRRLAIEHRPYWTGQIGRCQALLNEPALPTQTLKIVRGRLEEARTVLRSIESTSRDSRHAEETSSRSLIGHPPAGRLTCKMTLAYH